MGYDFKLAEKFLSAVQQMKLENLLGAVSSLEVFYNELSAAHDDARIAWMKEPGQASLSMYSKDSLLAEVRKQGVQHVRSSFPKEEILRKLLEHLWSQTEVAGSFLEIRKAHNRLQEWAESLRALPQALKDLVEEGDAVHREWLKGASRDLFGAATAVESSRTMDLMALAQAVPVARRSLAMLQNGESLPKIVKYIFEEVRSMVLGLHAENIKPTGMGMSHTAGLYAAQRLTWPLRDVIPDQAKPFTATMYSL